VAGLPLLCLGTEEGVEVVDAFEAFEGAFNAEVSGFFLLEGTFSSSLSISITTDTAGAAKSINLNSSFRAVICDVAHGSGEMKLAKSLPQFVPMTYGGPKILSTQFTAQPSKFLLWGSVAE
jgi:hypothetical protein